MFSAQSRKADWGGKEKDEAQGPTGVFVLNQPGITPTKLSYKNKPHIPSPADDNIAASDGDDVSPPNALPPGKVNMLVQHCVANVGFSSGPQRKNVAPTAMNMRLSVLRGGEGGSLVPGLEMELTLEYSNPLPGQSMVVFMKKLKQFVSDEKRPGQELILVDTCFRDFNDATNEWTDISADIRYAEEAEAVVQAVVSSDSGQTAGKVSSTALVEDAKLGPVGTKGRIVLTYRARELYTYAQMSLSPDQFEERELLPLAVFLPRASLFTDHATSVSVELHVPRDTQLLSPAEAGNLHAFEHLESVAPLDKAALLVPSKLENPNRNNNNSNFSFSAPALPPNPWALFFWLSVPVQDEALAAEIAQGMEGLMAGDGAQSVITLHAPSDEADPFMIASAPGAGQAPVKLIRATLQTQANKLPEDSVRLCTHLTVSDTSGSTGMRVDPSSSGKGGGLGSILGFASSAFGGSAGGRGDNTVRARFNELEELRLLNRLMAVPALVQAGVLRNQDLWAECFYIFSHTVQKQFRALFRVGDLTDEPSVRIIVDAVANNNPSAGKNLCPAARSVLNDLLALVGELRKLRATGGTSFAAPAAKAASEYPAFIDRVRQMVPAGKRLLQTTYCNFDTDGGNNYGSCAEELKKMVEKCDIQGGLVNGFGAWVNQDCASRVATILGGPCLLSLQVPTRGSEGQNEMFRRDVNCWIKTLRKNPVEVRLRAGAVTWRAARGLRNENAVDVLACSAGSAGGGDDGDDDEGTSCKFGLPDVSDPLCTGSVIEGLNGGERATLYLQTRVSVQQLARQLTVCVNGTDARVEVDRDSLDGVFLAHEWISALQANSKKIAHNKSVLGRRLRERMEDDLSFNWNLVTPLGSTAYLGRAKTQNRPSLSKEQQPAEPKLEMKPPAAPVISRRGFGVSSAFGSTFGSTFGSARPAPGAAAMTRAARMPKRASIASRGGGRATASKKSRKSTGVRSSRKILASKILGADQVAQPAVSTPSRILEFSHYLSLGVDAHGNPVEPDTSQAVQNLSVEYERLRGGNMTYHCDFCRTQIKKNMVRFHCLDCIDFDMCHRCYSSDSGRQKQGHTKSHLVRKISPRQSKKQKEDPLVGVLFGGVQQSSSAAAQNQGQVVDQTVVAAKCTLAAFLTALRTWQPWVEMLLHSANAAGVLNELQNIRKCL